MLLLVAALGVGWAPHASAATLPRAVGDIEVFARLGPPGHPDALAVASDGSVWVGSNGGAQNTPAPSVITQLSPTGDLLREITVTGQDLERDHGLLAIVLDDRDRLYVVDRSPARVLRIDPRTAVQETYAQIPDLASCGAAPCEPGPDQVPWPNGAAFAADGTLYVADFAQATVFRVPAGGGDASGGDAQVWLQDARYISPFGINSLAFDAAGRLLFTTTVELVPQPPRTGPGTGGIRRVTIEPSGAPGAVADVWTARPGDGPDGLAVAASGAIYATTLVSNHVVALTSDGEETARHPADPRANLALEVPLDNPASIRFAGTRLLITNLSFFRSDPDSYAVLALDVGEPGLPLHRPRIGSPAPAARPAPTRPRAPAPVVSPPAPLPATGPWLPYAAPTALALLVGAGLVRVFGRGDAQSA